MHQTKAVVMVPVVANASLMDFYSMLSLSAEQVEPLTFTRALSGEVKTTVFIYTAIYSHFFSAYN